MKFFYPGCFSVMEKCLGCFCLFFCYAAFFTQTLIDNEGSLYLDKGTVLFIEKDTSLIDCDHKNAVIFIEGKAQVYGIEYINSSHSIIYQKNSKVLLKMNVKPRIYKTSVKNYSDKTVKSHFRIYPDEIVSSTENILHQKSSDCFTISNDFNNTAIILLSNINLKTAFLVPSYFKAFSNFLLESSLEKKWFPILIYKVLLNEHKVRPPPCR